MILSEKLNLMFNHQAAHERLNYNKYIVMASYFDKMQLNNLSKYFYEQANEEKGHFDLIVSHINDRVGGKYIPMDINVELEITSINELANLYLITEQQTTESLELIYDEICEEKSFIDKEFITKMLGFQVEEENSAENFLKKVSYTNDLILLDMAFGD